MLNKVKKYIQKYNLLSLNKLYLVALSGGADSVCLLRIMYELKYNIHAVHCNFHLRGEESDRDENFCKKLCDELQIPLHIAHFDTKEYAQLHKVSIEMAARDLRYAYFEDLRKAIEANAILVAHHRDDNIETLIINLVRGTGLQGLEGIKPVNGKIIRPMLSVSRQEIDKFLADIGQTFVVDSTNLVDDVVRNKVRLNIIPLLEDINPAVKDNIMKTIEHISEANKVIKHAMEISMSQCVEMKSDCISIDTETLKSQPSAEYTLYTILSPYGFTASQINNIYENIDAQAGRIWTSATHTLAKDRKNLLIEERLKSEHEAHVSIVLPETGVYSLAKGGMIELSYKERKEDFIPSKDKWHITLDASLVSFPLTLRRIKTGDRFTPFGMTGSKLVSDYLTDRKKNYFQRQRQLVLEDTKGKIIWVVGERTSQKVAVSNKTINILEIRYNSNEQ